MKHSVFSFIFVLSIIFCQEKLVHINKTYPDGKPKEILIYKQINDELKSTKPLLLIEKMGRFSAFLSSSFSSLKTS